MAKGVLSYLVIAAFAAWCVHGLSKDAAQINLSALDGSWGVVLLSGVLSLANYALRIVRWHVYLKHMGRVVPFRLSALSYMAGFAFTLSPGKVGEMIRVRYYRRHGVSMGDVSVAFFAERLMDLLVIVVLAGALLASLPDYRWLGGIGVGASLGVLLVLHVMPWTRLHDWLGRQGGAHPSALVRGLQKVAGLLFNSRQLLSHRMLLLGFVAGLTAWGLEAIGFKLVGDVISPNAGLAWTAGVGIYATATLVGALSFLPGGLGSTEAVMTGLLVTHHFSMGDALLLTLVCRVLTLWLAVLIGWICVWLLRHEN